MKADSIIDTSKPSAGRIYDFLLGGHHNFEVDRIAAQQVSALLPFVPKAMRLQRWCLQDLAVDLTEQRGYDVIIDFASGLPTNDHIHHVVPAGTTVIYSDSDPIVVEYAREILADTPNVYFFQGDARRPEELVQRPAVQEILGGRRDVAIAYWGVSMFLEAEDIAWAARSLYDWAGPKSCLVFQAQGADMDVADPAFKGVIDLYAQMGSPIMPRSLAVIEQLLQLWHPDERGWTSLLDWHSLDQSTMTHDDSLAFGSAGGGYGAYLIK
jgi:S-adenosyl methyltransferase